jgi:predicted ATPase/class 3 adenylate cyclase
VLTVLPTGTVTFLFTDLEGSTRLWEEHPDAMRAALARHDEILRDAVEKRDGYLVKTTGDGLHAAFAVAPDAVAAALDAQRALTREKWTLPEPLKVRMGLHTGVAEVRDGDYYGTAVNRAARVAAAAHGGQVVASAATADLVRDDLGAEVTLIDLGEHRLRDLGRPERIVQLSHPELSAEFPALRSLDAYPGNLPVQRTAFVGRAEDLAAVRAALDGSPVITLTGVGGVGKTRLALQVAADAVARFPDGAWFVDLGPVLDAEYVAAAFGAALRLPERRQGTVEDSIVASLRDKRLLVVLDNCEHVIDAVADLVDLVIGSCPGVSVLATSREALGVDGEDSFDVRPLSVGVAGARDALDALLDNDACRLFAERAHSAKRDFTLSVDNALVVAEICRRLDGIPLAIELAAARMKMMSAPEVLARLDERFQLLAGGRRAVLERHQTLRGAIDWSYELLEPAEQVLFARLSVFAGGFTLDAAETVGAGDDVAAESVLALLGSLVGKSMVVTDDTDAGTRYRLLETLREYATERLGEVDDPERVHARHAAYFLALVETVAPMLKGPEDEIGLARLMADHDNLRATLGWSRDHDDSDKLARLVHSLYFFWWQSETWREMNLWTQAALGPLDALAPGARAEVLAFAGHGANYSNGFDEAMRLYEASLECSRDAGLVPSSYALGNLGVAALESNRPADAIELCEQGVDASRAEDDLFSEINARLMLATVCNLAGEAERGRALADESLARARRLGNRFLTGSALLAAGIGRVATEPEVAIELLEELDRTIARTSPTRSQTYFWRGIAHLRLRQPAAAARAFRTALPLMVESGSDFFTATIVGTAAALVARADPAIAVQILAALDRHRTDSGMEGAPSDVEVQRRTRARIEESMNPDEFAAAWARGAQLSVEEAAFLAHDALGPIATADLPDARQPD